MSLAVAALVLLAAPDGGVTERRAANGRVVARFDDARFATWYETGARRSEGQLRSPDQVQRCHARLEKSPSHPLLGAAPRGACGRAGERIGHWRAWAPDGGVVFDQTFRGGYAPVERVKSQVAVVLTPAPRDDTSSLERFIVSAARVAALQCHRAAKEATAWGPLQLDFELRLMGPAQVTLLASPPQLPPGWRACFEQKFRGLAPDTWHGAVRVSLLLIVDTPLPGLELLPAAEDCSRLDRQSCDTVRGCRWGIIRACPTCLGGREGCTTGLSPDGR